MYNVGCMGSCKNKIPYKVGISKEYEVISAVMDNGPVLMANFIAADAVPKAMENADE